MYKIQLPINIGYREFYSKYEDLLQREAVYRLSFTEGDFYIGCSGNLASRIYNHVTMGDINGCKNFSNKHKRMQRAIDNSEIVEFTIIGDNMYDERKFIIESENDIKCLNMKR